MKIVHICSTLTDGLSYQENLLTKYHKKLGFDVDVISSKWGYNSDGKLVYKDIPGAVNPDGVNVIRFEIKGKKSYYYKFKRLAGLQEALEKAAPDLLFVHGCQFLDIDRIVKYLQQHPSVTVYVDNHADFSNSATNWLSKNILHKVIWRSCAHQIEPYTRKFYGVLPARVDFLTDVYGLPKEKCELLVMGADDELVEKAKNSGARERIRERYGIADNDFLVVTGGKIDQWKTQTLLLMEAVRKIDRDNLKLLIFGSIAPELRPKVEQLVDRKKVWYVGWIQADESYDYLEAADLAVFPGRHSVLWEQAVGQGVPMMVKDWPGTHHVDLGGNVRFLTQDDAEEIRRELLYLLENPEVYQKMRSIAETEGMKAFSYREIARKSICLEE